MIAGRYFDAASSRGYPAQLQVYGEGIVQLQAPPYERQAAVATVRVSERIGSIPRRLTFPDGGIFETSDNDAVDALFAGTLGRARFAHWLERSWPVALGSLVAVAAITLLFLRFGVPAVAGWAARELPPSVDAAIGAQSLRILDKGFLRPSELPAQRQRELQQLFAAMTADIDDGHTYRLLLRRSNSLGANAIALPAGIIVMTDSLVALAQQDDELRAVLAHEIGHVRGRHALRQLLQSAGISAIAVVLLGDLNSISALASAVPLLLQAKNSRDFEREADEFARRWLQGERIPLRRFDDMLCRLIATKGSTGEEVLAYLS
ncbi:MAG: M48 family metallopeptidase, partial [Pseudomonadota bacterium]